jgi:hypothetical protein
LVEASVLADEAGGGLRRLFQRALRIAASADPGGLATDARLDDYLGTATSGLDDAFFGRDAEIAQVMGAIRGALDTGTGLVVHLSGEAGIGKTRLAMEIAERLQHVGVAVASLGFEAFGIGTRHIGERLAAALPDGPPPDVADPFDRAVIGALRGQKLDATNELRLSALVPAERLRRYIAMTRRLLTHAAKGRGLLLVVEDCHWAPHPAATFLLDVSDEASRSPVVFLITERPGDDMLAPRLATRGQAPLSRLQLAPLDALQQRHSLGRGTYRQSRSSALLHVPVGTPCFFCGCSSRTGRTMRCHQPSTR